MCCCSSLTACGQLLWYRFVSEGPYTGYKGHWHGLLSLICCSWSKYHLLDERLKKPDLLSCLWNTNSRFCRPNMHQSDFIADEAVKGEVWMVTESCCLCRNPNATKMLWEHFCILLVVQNVIYQKSSYCLLELAEACNVEWHNFISKHVLLDNNFVYRMIEFP